MARGYPDYFGFATSGGAGGVLYDAFPGNMLAGANGFIAEILGQRYIVNIRFLIVGTESHLDDSIALYIEAVGSRAFGFAEMASGCYNTERPTLPIPEYIGSDGLLISGYFCGNFTVATRLRVWYNNASGEDQFLPIWIASSPVG